MKRATSSVILTMASNVYILEVSTDGDNANRTKIPARIFHH